MDAFIDLYPIASYALAALIPVLVLSRAANQRGKWAAAATLAHLAMVNLFNRAVWPALRPAPREHPPGSKAHLDETLAYIHENLAYSIVASLLVILVACLAWRWRQTRARDPRAT